MNHIVQNILSSSATFFKSPTAVPTSAFCCGFAWSCKNMSLLLTYTASSTLNGLINGCAMAFGAGFVSDLLSEQYRPFFALLLALSTVYRFMKSREQTCTIVKKDVDPED